jgi:hypothetical protein
MVKVDEQQSPRLSEPSGMPSMRPNNATHQAAHWPANSPSAVPATNETSIVYSHGATVATPTLYATD